MKEVVLKLTEEESKWVRVALDREGDVQSNNGNNERSNFLYGLAMYLKGGKQPPLRIDKIRWEFSILMEYIESNYIDKAEWKMDGEKVLKQLYKLSEAIYGKKVEEPLVEYEDE